MSSTEKIGNATVRLCDIAAFGVLVPKRSDYMLFFLWAHRIIQSRGWALLGA